MMMAVIRGDRCVWGQVGKNPLTPAGALMLLAAIKGDNSKVKLLDITVSIEPPPTIIAGHIDKYLTVEIRRCCAFWHCPVT